MHFNSCMCDIKHDFRNPGKPDIENRFQDNKTNVNSYMQYISMTEINKRNLDVNLEMLHQECIIDLDIFAKRLKKGLDIERMYRDDLYEYLYGIGWPELEFLRMSKVDIKAFNDERAAEEAREKKAKVKGRRRRSSMEDESLEDIIPKKKEKKFRGSRKGKMQTVGITMPYIDQMAADEVIMKNLFVERALETIFRKIEDT